MASYRIGIGSFNLKDGNIGIGTETTGFGNLKVEGTLKTSDLDVGVSTFTRYAGFEGEETKFDKDVDLSGEYSTTGDIVVEPGATLTVGLGSTACIGSVECISVKHHFSVPVGDTAGRNKSSGYTEGTVRYNRDLGTMEFYNGNEWRQFTYIADIQNSSGSRGRALFFGGYTEPANTNSLSIDVVTISTLGNTTRFGEMAGSNDSSFGIGNQTRGIYSRGGNSSDILEYVTPASEGNPIDFGDMSVAKYLGARGNSSTRGIFLGGLGNPAYSNVIDYIEMGTLGNALDFGDLNTAVFLNNTSVNSTVRVYSLGGYDSSANISKIEYVMTSTKANALEFDDLDRPNSTFPAFANNVRGVYGGGNLRPLCSAQIYMFNTASQGKMIYFGDLTQKRKEFAGSCSQTRGIFAGGQLDPGPSTVNTMDFITISSAGSAQDFGDLSKTPRNFTSLSDCHGGLGGY